MGRPTSRSSTARGRPHPPRPFEAGSGSGLWPGSPRSGARTPSGGNVFAGPACAIRVTSASWADFARLPRLSKAELVADQAGAPAVWHEPHPPARPLRARVPDLGYHGPADPMARDRGVMGVVGALLGLRLSGRGAGAERPPLLPLLVRPVRRLLGRARRCAGPRCVGHPGRRPGLADAASRDPGARRHRARLHAIVRAPPGRAGARPGHRPGGARRSGRRSTPGSQEPASPPCGSVWRRSGGPGRTTTPG